MIGSPLPIALTMGEPAGIGGELTLRAWLDRKQLGLPTFFAVDDVARLKALAGRLGWDVPIAEIGDPDDAADRFDDALPVLANPIPGSVVPGQPDPKNATAVIDAIRIGADLVIAGKAGALVTNPVHKKTLYDGGFPHPGHTEFLAELAGGVRSVMMLTCPGLRVIPVTGHVPLVDAISKLSSAEIVEVVTITDAALRRDFGIEVPHLMIAALNPHAGEDGSLGPEEEAIIRPAIDELKKRGLSVSGPAPADTLFHERAREAYDAAICMHHDQALIPLKTIDFHNGVNVTLGLPFVRTSPDHGTAFEIAGMGVADVTSLAAALTMARDIVACRSDGRRSQRTALA